MEQVTQTAAVIWAWIVANPASTILITWAVLNVLYAQLPMPKNPKLAALWQAVHTVCQFVTTHASDKGTFTWPFLLRVFIDALSAETSGSATPPSEATPLSVPTRSTAATAPDTPAAKASLPPINGHAVVISIPPPAPTGQKKDDEDE